MSLCTVLALAAGCPGGSSDGGGSASASAMTDEDVPVTFAPDVDDPDPGDTHTLTVVTGPAHGTAQVVAGGFRYTPDPDFNGVDDFTFLATDSQGHAFAGTATVTVSPVDDPPAPAALVLATDEDTPVTATPAVTDPDLGDTFTAAVVTQPANGAVVAAGTDLTYTPAADYSGTDGFTFAVTDGSGLTATATATVTVNPVNDPPTSATASVTAQAAVQTQVIPTVVDPDPGDMHAFTVLDVPDHGTAIDLGGQLFYTATMGFSGSDSFTFTATDLGGLAVNGTATIEVTGANQAPTSASAAITTNEDTPGAVTPSVTDPDAGDTHTFSIVSQPTDGTAAVVGGQLVYTPDRDFNGGDSFTFQATDAGGLSLVAPATASVTVTPVNDPPSIASHTVIVTPEDTAGTSGVDVDDPDTGDAYTLSIVSQAANGTAGVMGTDLTYAPDADFFGSDAFTFRVQDADGAFVTGTANVTVNPVNDAPVLGDLAVTTLPDTATSNLLVSDVLTDPDPGDMHTLTLQSVPANGTVAVSGLRITYTPDAGFFGVDVITFSVHDGTVDSNTGTARVSVTGRFATGDRPVAVAFGDFDGDGNPDIAVADELGDEQDEVVSLYFGDGAGGLSARVAVPPTNPGGVFLGAVALAVGDLDKDGDDDLVIVYRDNDGYAVALGDPVRANIVAGATVDLGVGTLPRAAALADFDGDAGGFLDLGVANLLTDQVLVFAGLGDGTFGTLLDTLDLGAVTSPADVRAGDLDGDTLPDLATVALQANANNRRWVTPWINDGTGLFTAAAGQTTALDVQGDADLALGDLDGDGRDDAVRTLSGEDRVAVLAATALGALPAATEIAVGAAPSGVALGDVNGSGNLDIVTTDRLDNGFSVLAGAGDGTFGAPKAGPVLPAPGGLAVADLNGDGRDDVATVHPDNNLLGVILR